VFSGLSIGFLGMGWTLGISIALTAVALVHLFFVKIPEKDILHDPALAGNKIDFKGGYRAIRAVPGLTALILFGMFNNLIGGVFIALMDPYGLTLFTVQWWGVVLGISSAGMILGGLIVGKKGLGKNPLRTLLLVNVVIAVVSILFTIREWWPLYVLGVFMYMLLFPAVEASEQTVLQRVVPFDHQGRVFGLAMSVEAGAAPITAFMIGPVAQFWIIPYFSGAGASQWAWLLGTGEARGIAAIFVAAGLIMLAVALLAFKTRSYGILSKEYAEA
jgi:DHA3 family multidrug efflux protein-like MFS transporter